MVLAFSQDYETDTAGLFLSGVCARSNVTPLAGSWSLRAGAASSDGNAVWPFPSLSDPSRISIASLTFETQFKINATPSGGDIRIVFGQGGYQKAGGLIPGFALIVRGGLTSMRFVSGSETVPAAFTDGSASLGTTTHSLRLEYVELGNATYNAKVYIDGSGTPDIDHNASDWALGWMRGFFMGVAAGAKVSWAAQWDDTSLNYTPRSHVTPRAKALRRGGMMRQPVRGERRLVRA